MRHYDEAVILMHRHEELMKFVGERSDELIHLGELTLGVQFPPTYKRFSKEFGAGSFDIYTYFGLIDEDFSHSGIPDAIWYTLTERIDSSLPDS